MAIIVHIPEPAPTHGISLLRAEVVEIDGTREVLRIEKESARVSKRARARERQRQRGRERERKAQRL